MKQEYVTNESHRNNERGNVLAYTVLSVLFLFFAVGLGVDLSHLYLVKTELQDAADAGALAGASALTLPNPQRITTAVDRAVNTMNLNKYNFNNRTFAAVMDTTAQRSLVTFAVNLSGPYISEAAATASPNNIRFVRVNTPTVPVDIFFAALLIGSTQNLNAKATSGLSVPGNVNYCMAPLSAVECDPGNPPASCQMAQTFWGTCPGANPNGIQTYPDGTTCDPTRQFCKSCTYTIRSGPAVGPSPGNYQILACAGNGGSAVKNALAAYGAACQCGNVSPGGTVQVQTKPGVTAGPVQDGLNVRFDIYGGGLSYSTTTPPDTNIAQTISWDQYKASNPFTAPSAGDVGVSDRRVLIIPIIPVSQFSNGRSTVTVGSIGGFFMQQQVAGGNGGDIQAEYIGSDIVGVVGFDPNGNNSTNVVTPVLYR